jgi:uncharacterized protein YbaR (Trm112 family)
MTKGSDRIKVVCPLCNGTLTVDPRTGLVLHSEGKKSGYSFEDALDQVHTRKEKSDDLFQKAFEDERERREGLEGKFREALDSQDELDEPPNPWEMD